MLFQIVLDIHEYVTGDIKVKILNKELIVEGEVKDKTSVCTQNSFKKSFFLNEIGETDNISAVVSEDGILTIIVPKKVNDLKGC